MIIEGYDDVWKCHDEIEVIQRSVRLVPAPQRPVISRSMAGDTVGRGLLLEQGVCRARSVTASRVAGGGRLFYECVRRAPRPMASSVASRGQIVEERVPRLHSQTRLLVVSSSVGRQGLGRELSFDAKTSS